MSDRGVAVLSVVVRRRWNRFAGVVALVATMGAAAAAFQIDPEVLTQVSTPSTGLWIPGRSTGDIMQIDAASGTVTARVKVGVPGSELVLAERDHGVIVVDRTTGRVALVDPGLQQVVRSVAGVPAPEAAIDIGPDGIVAAAAGEVTLVDLSVTSSISGRIPLSTRSAVADGAGAQVENGASLVSIAADGSTEDQSDSDGILVRVGTRAFVASPSGVRTVGGSSVACFDGEVTNPQYVVGSSIEWVVAIEGRTVHVADLTNGECAAVTLADDVGELGRPVVAGRRVYVPERRTGAVHIVEPSQEVSDRHEVLPAGDLRLRAREDLVVAYDADAPLAAVLDIDGVVRIVDTSIDGRGVLTVFDEDGPALVIDGGGEDVPETGVADGVSTGGDAPVIDAGVLTSDLQNPVDGDAIPGDDLVANFAFSATTVTVGESVRFVDGSTGGPETWLWDFGDGTGAQGPEVQKAWDEPGTYTVVLQVTRGDETAEISLAITVVPVQAPVPPAADFVFSSTVVSVGREIAFEDRSDGEIERWRWDFGDGTSATTPDATKAWATPGRYRVQLTVANEQGSDAASVFVDVVEGLRAPVAVLTAPKTEVDLGAPVTFRGSSSTDPAAYSWNFGDGRTSTGPNVVHVFLAEGTFRVTLTASNAAGRSTATVDIVVSPPTTAPTAAIGTLPAVIEVGDVVVVSSLSTNSPDSETWSFGDGATATGTRVTHTWETPGNYLLSLTAVNSAGTDTATKTVVVVSELPPPVAVIGDFDEAPWVGAATVFIDASIDATSWLWDFGDGATSTARNPLHTFTSAGEKVVTLTVNNRNGSNSTSVVVEPRLEPTASFFVSSSAIRAGDSVTFTDDSVNAVSWAWDFGDGTTSTVQNPVHTYTTTGTFDVVLRVQNSTGDEGTFGPVSIDVDPAAPRLAGILKVPTDGDTIPTLATSSFAAVVDPTSGPIDAYQIDFGDGSPSMLGSSGTFTHVFNTGGTYVVTMQARGPLGDFSPPVTRAFTVIDPPPPLVSIASSVPASALVGTVTLTGVENSGSGPIAAWRWEIRQSGSLWEYTGRVVDHVFTEAGVYSLTLIAESPVSSVADAVVSRDITITVPPPPDIVSLTASPATATEGVLVQFTPTVTGSVSTWRWNYGEGGGFVTGGSVGEHFFNTAGNKTVTLEVTGPFGQQDVMTVGVTVNPKPSPTVPVAVPGGVVTAGTTVNLTSSDSGGRTGLQWDWTISNGATTIPYTNAGPSIDHVFGTAGTWTVTVRATDSLGVSGTNTASVTVQAPLTANFTHQQTAVPFQVQFNDTSTGPPVETRSWDFGNGTTSTAANPLVTYLGPGDYSVRLTVTAGSQTDVRVITVTVV